MQSSYGEELGVGEKIAGRYEVLSVLGKGSFGVVYKAKHDILGRIVAIKTLRLQRIVDDRSAKRFEREAKVACMVEHANIIKVFDFGYTGEGVPYLVMDYVSGIPLFNILKEERCITPERAVLLFSQVCDGLYQAHQRGVIHRDLKPANIMVVKKDNEPETVRIVDLGVAKIVAGSEEESEAITRTGEVCGSPIYLSPEQCVYAELDPRTDIYSLGVCLYESLTGVPPLRGATVYDTIYMHVNDTPKPFKVVAPDLDIPPRIEEIVMRCLSKQPCDRFETMQEVKQELLNALKEGPERNVLAPEELFANKQVPSTKKNTAGTSGSYGREAARVSAEQQRVPIPPTDGAPLPPNSREMQRAESTDRRGEVSGESRRRSRDTGENERPVSKKANPEPRRPGLADTITERIQQTDTVWKVIACAAIVLAVAAGSYAFYVQQSVESKLRSHQQQVASSSLPPIPGDDQGGDASKTAAPATVKPSKSATKSPSNHKPPVTTADKKMPVTATKPLAHPAGEKDKERAAGPAKTASTTNKNAKSPAGNPQDGTAAMAFAGMQIQSGFGGGKQQPSSASANVQKKSAAQPTGTAKNAAKEGDNGLMQAWQNVFGGGDAANKTTPNKAPAKKAATGAHTLQQMDAKLDPRLDSAGASAGATQAAVPSSNATPPPAPRQPVNQPLSSASVDLEMADKFYRRAYGEFDAGNVSEAVKLFRSAFERAPNEQYKSAYAQALTQYAFLCNKAGDYAGAVTHQQRACDLYPGNEKYQRNLNGYQSNKQRGVQ